MQFSTFLVYKRSCNAANAREESEFETRTGLESPIFAAGPFLGNIGGPVRTLLNDFDDDYLEYSGKSDADQNYDMAIDVSGDENVNLDAD